MPLLAIPRAPQPIHTHTPLCLLPARPADLSPGDTSLGLHPPAMVVGTAAGAGSAHTGPVPGPQTLAGCVRSHLPPFPVSSAVRQEDAWLPGGVRTLSLCVRQSLLSRRMADMYPLTQHTLVCRPARIPKAHEALVPRAGRGSSGGAGLSPLTFSPLWTILFHFSSQ